MPAECVGVPNVFLGGTQGHAAGLTKGIATTEIEVGPRERERRWQQQQQCGREEGRGDQHAEKGKLRTLGYQDKGLSASADGRQKSMGTWLDKLLCVQGHGPICIGLVDVSILDRVWGDSRFGGSLTLVPGFWFLKVSFLGLKRHLRSRGVRNGAWTNDIKAWETRFVTSRVWLALAR